MYTYHSEKYDFVKWDYEFPNMMGKIIPNVPNHPPGESEVLKALDSEILRTF